jgi:hypothetical protein
MDQSQLQNFIENSYQLVLWPEVQDLMEYDWFRQECILYNAFDDQLYLDSAYFVPTKRMMEVDEHTQRFIISCQLNML